MAKDDTSQIPNQGVVALGNAPVPPTRKTSDFLTEGFQGWSFTAITAIAQDVASIKLRLVKKQNKNLNRIEEHEILSTLQHVNDFTTFYSLVEITQIYQELTGEAYWALLRSKSSKRILEIWPLRPDWVYPLPDPKEFIRGYEYRPSGVGGSKVTFAREDIIPFKFPNPINPYRGKSVIQAAALAIDTDIFSAEWNRNFFFNSALPSLVFSTDKILPETSVKRMITDWENKYKGRDRAHKVAVMTGGLKPEKISSTHEEASFLEQRKNSRDEILSVFRVPKTIAAITDDVNRANAEATKVVYMRNVVKPRMLRFVYALNEFFIPNFADKNLFLDFEDPAGESQEEKLAYYENGIKNFWLTPNEVRKMEGLDPIEGGDAVVIPTNYIVANGEKPNQNGVKLLASSSSKKQYISTVNPPAPPVEHFLKEKVKEDILKKDVKTSIIKLLSNLVTKKEIENKEVYWRDFVKRTDAFEEEYKAKLRLFFNNQETEMKLRLDGHKFIIEKNNIVSWLPDKKDSNDELKRIMKPLIKEVVYTMGNRAIQEVKEFNLATARVAFFLRVDGLRFITDINETTIEMLKETLGEGIEFDESIAQLKKRIVEVYEAARGYRAEAIARTEVLRASNFATDEGYRQSGVVKSKEWLTEMDGRTEEACIKMNGQVVPMGGQFASEVLGIKLEMPPLHVNCRCTILPVIK